MDDILEARNVMGEVKTMRVSDPGGGLTREVKVMAFEFEMDSEGSIFYQAGTDREWFTIPRELEGYFVQFGHKYVLWCTWKENEGKPIRPTAVPFRGTLLPLQ